MDAPGCTVHAHFEQSLVDVSFPAVASCLVELPSLEKYKDGRAPLSPFRDQQWFGLGSLTASPRPIRAALLLGLESCLDRWFRFFCASGMAVFARRFR